LIDENQYDIMQLENFFNILKKLNFIIWIITNEQEGVMRHFQLNKFKDFFYFYIIVSMNEKSFE